MARAAEEGGAAANRAGRIRLCIEARFAPVLMELEDESARHAGHAGVRDGCGETHFALLVVSEAFDGLGRVQRSRAVHEALAAEFAGGLHALTLTLRTPAEQPAGPAGDQPDGMPR